MSSRVRALPLHAGICKQVLGQAPRPCRWRGSHSSLPEPTKGGRPLRLGTQVSRGPPQSLSSLMAPGKCVTVWLAWFVLSQQAGKLTLCSPGSLCLLRLCSPWGPLAIEMTDVSPCSNDKPCVCT